MVPSGETVAVVTGGSTGIGKAIAEAFHEYGARVVLLARDANRAEAARNEIGDTSRALAFSCDVRKREDVDRAIQVTLDRFQRIDVWVNNAGYGMHDTVVEMDLQACRDLFETNIFGLLNGMQAIVPVMSRQGGGSIINISSVAGHIPLLNGAAYSATKFAVNAFSKAARMELREKNIHVLTVCPGYVYTEFAKNIVLGERLKNLEQPKAHGITPERVARAVLSGYMLKKRQVIVPWTMIPVVKLYQLFPGLVEWGMQRMDRRISANRP